MEINNCIKEMSDPNYMLTLKADLNGDDGLAKAGQLCLMTRFPGKTCQQVQMEGLRSFKELKAKCLEFREAVENAPEEILPTKRI